MVVMSGSIGLAVLPMAHMQDIDPVGDMEGLRTQTRLAQKVGEGLQ